MQSLISTSVQLFIAWRIKVISRSLVMPLIICALGFTALGRIFCFRKVPHSLNMVTGGGLALSVFTVLKPQYFHFIEYKNVIITWLTASAVADVLITITLTWTLVRGYVYFALNRSEISFQTKRKTGMKDTDDRVSKIIRCTRPHLERQPAWQISTIHSHYSHGSSDFDSSSRWSHRLSNTSGVCPYSRHSRYTCGLLIVSKGTTLNFIWDLTLAKMYINSLLST